MKDFTALVLATLLFTPAFARSLQRRDCDACNSFLQSTNQCLPQSNNVLKSEAFVSCYCALPDAGQNARNCGLCGGPSGYTQREALQIELFYYVCEATAANGPSAGLACLDATDEGCSGFLSGNGGSTITTPIGGSTITTPIGGSTITTPIGGSTISVPSSTITITTSTSSNPTTITTTTSAHSQPSLSPLTVTTTSSSSPVPGPTTTSGSSKLLSTSMPALLAGAAAILLGSFL